MSVSKVQRLLDELYGYYAIFIGVTSYRYDYKSQLYKKSKWTQLVASLGNLIAIVMLPLDIYYASTKTFGMDCVTELTTLLVTIVHDVICLLLLLQRVPRENANKEISQQLKRLQRIYRYRYRYRDRQLELKLERIYLLKNCLIWMLIVFLLSFMLINYGVISVDFESPILGRIWVVLKVVIVDGEDVIMHMHFMLTWRFCRLYMCLNSRIGKLIKTNNATVTLEMHHLRWQHYQLTKLLERLNVPYNFTLIIIRFFLIVTAVALGYYLIIFRSPEYHLIYTLSAVALYAVICLSCYMLDLLYDLTKQSHRETSWQLRQINELANADEQFSRGCELFVLQIACFPLEIKPYGLYASGMSTLLSNIFCIFSWMIVLLQYYMVLGKGKPK
ncbi:hypothetical protein ACLKA6_000361 [Drosophila palustris]